MRTAKQVLNDVPDEVDLIRLEMELKENIENYDIDNRDRNILRGKIRDVIGFYRSVARKLKIVAELDKKDKQHG
jgi:hypothetical protein